MRVLSLISLLFFSFNLISQTSFVNIKEDKILINGYSTDILQTKLKGEFDFIKKYWSKYTKEKLKQKSSSKDNLITTSEVVINQVSDKRGDLLAYMYNENNDVYFNIAFKLGYDVYLNSEKYPNEVSKFKSFFEFFIFNYYDNYYPYIIKQNQKILKKLNKEKSRAESVVKKMTNQNSKFEKSNKKSNKRIEKLKLKKASEPDTPVKIDELNKQISLNSEHFKINEKEIITKNNIIETLKPTIDSISSEINQDKLNLLEVKAKIKSF